MLGADGQADGVLVDLLLGQFGVVQLAVGGGSRVDDQALHVGHVGQQGEDLQVVDELEGFLAAALDIKGKDGGAAVGEILLIQRVVGVIGQGRMVDLLDLGMVGQERDDLLGVLDVALDAQAQSLGALQQQECVERRDGGTGIAQQNGADVGDEGGGAGGIGKGDAVVAGVGGGDVGITAAGFPVEVAAVHDDAAQRGAVAADELGGGVDHDVCAVLDGADQIRSAEGVINDQRQAMLMGDGCDGVDVGDVAVGVAQGLQIDGLGVGLDGVLHLGQVVGVHEGGGDAELGQGVLQQVVAAAVDGLLGHDVVTGLCQSLDGVADGSSTGSGGQRSHAAFQRGDALLEDVLGGVGQAAIDVACVSQTEAVGGVLAVAEDVGRGLVDGHGAGIGGGIGLLLANVQLKGLEFIVRHVDCLSFCTNSIIFIYKKSRSLRSQDSAPGKKILTCFGALPARTHSSGGGQSTAVRPEFCPVCVHSPTTEVCMKQVFPNQRHRGALLSLNFPPSLWIGWLHYIPIYLDCQ